MADSRKKMPRPVPLADLLDTVFRGKPAGRRLEEGRIWLVWDAAVGPQIAGKARPVSFRDGILTVAVANSPWMQQLTFLKQGMIEKLNQRLGGDLVRDIYLKAGLPEKPASAPKQAPRRSKPVSPEQNSRIAAQTSSLADPELREAFRRLLARYSSDSRSLPD